VFRVIATDDGSVSLFTEEYGQAMHTTDGALTEAFVRHVLASRVLERSTSEITVLDVGFGLGYNALALIEALADRKNAPFVRVISLEKDLSHLDLMETIRFEGRRAGLYGFLKKAAKHGRACAGGFDLTVLAGDARSTLRSLSNERFDAVFHDPYSPAANCELWTVDFFREIRARCAAMAILTTYSSASQARGALLESGFCIGRGPSLGRKREGTLASPSASALEAFSVDEIAELQLNPKSSPYRDDGLNNARDAIRAQRSAEMKDRRLKRGPQARR
jgi:tRNA U34 5-methylaminomethyl-2-thiouridine-forming methyltransferase MnmC